MVQEIVFHLGDCKTGTTSIQSTLAEGLFTVEGKTFLYPTKMNHIPTADTLRSKANPELRHERWSKLSDRILRSDKEVAIISAETFEFVRPKQLASVIDTYFKDFKAKIRLIAYVRPHAERLTSAFAERSKQGKFWGDMEAAHEHFLSTGLLNYLPRFTRWRAVFGDAYHVRPMIRSRLRGGDVVEDFLDFAFSGAKVDIDKNAVSNESLTLADLLAMRRVHQRLAESKLYSNDLSTGVGWNLATLVSTLPKPAKAEKPRLHKELAEKVREAYLEDAKALDAAFFEGTPLADALIAAAEKAPAEVQSLAVEDYFSDDALRVIDGVSLLMRRVMEADPLHFQVALRPEKLRPVQTQGTFSAVGAKRAGNKRPGKRRIAPQSGA